MWLYAKALGHFQKSVACLYNAQPNLVYIWSSMVKKKIGNRWLYQDASLSGIGRYVLIRIPDFLIFSMVSSRWSSISAVDLPTVLRTGIDASAPGLQTQSRTQQRQRRKGGLHWHWIWKTDWPRLTQRRSIFASPVWQGKMKTRFLFLLIFTGFLRMTGGEGKCSATGLHKVVDKSATLAKKPCYRCDITITNTGVLLPLQINNPGFHLAVSNPRWVYCNLVKVITGV